MARYDNGGLHCCEIPPDRSPSSMDGAKLRDYIHLHRVAAPDLSTLNGDWTDHNVMVFICWRTRNPRSDRYDSTARACPSNEPMMAAVRSFDQYRRVPSAAQSAGGSTYESISTDLGFLVGGRTTRLHGARREVLAKTRHRSFQYELKIVPLSMRRT